jgi:hypothetical protein
MTAVPNSMLASHLDVLYMLSNIIANNLISHEFAAGPVQISLTRPRMIVAA